MRYDNIIRGIFLSRPNRFIANVMIDGEIQVAHVRNTGRCRELLVEGCTVYLEISKNPARKTKFDLVAVNKDGRLINMDSQAPNRAVEEFLLSDKARSIFPGLSVLKREKVFGTSRFDFYGVPEESGYEFFLEVKGVTLEENGVVKFPDAPTQRGIKHLQELEMAVMEGYGAYVFFLVQMENVKYFEPNRKTHPEFARALLSAENSGVNILCYDSVVTPDSMTVGKPVEVRI